MAEQKHLDSMWSLDWSHPLWGLAVLTAVFSYLSIVMRVAGGLLAPLLAPLREGDREAAMGASWKTPKRSWQHEHRAESMHGAGWYIANGSQPLNAENPVDLVGPFGHIPSYGDRVGLPKEPETASATFFRCSTPA